MKGALLAVALTAAFGAGAVAAAGAQSAPAPSAAAREAAFLRTVNPRNTANVVTGDLVAYAGTHVAYDCGVDAIVRAGVILGNCGSSFEPMDLFVEVPTAHVRVGDRLRIIGVVDRPASWSDVTGHTVYYAFIRSIFAHRLR